MIRRFVEIAERMMSQPFYRLVLLDGEAAAAMAWDGLHWLGAVWSYRLNTGVFRDESAWTPPLRLTIPNYAKEPLHIRPTEDGLEITWPVGDVHVVSTAPYFQNVYVPESNPGSAVPLARIPNPSGAVQRVNIAADFDDHALPGMVFLPEIRMLIGLSRTMMVAEQVEATVHRTEPIAIPQAVARFLSSEFFSAAEFYLAGDSIVVRVGDLVFRTPRDSRSVAPESIESVMQRVWGDPREGEHVAGFFVDREAMAQHLRPHLAVARLLGTDGVTRFAIDGEQLEVRTADSHGDIRVRSRMDARSAGPTSHKVFVSHDVLRSIVAFLERIPANELLEWRMAGFLLAMRSGIFQMIASTIVPQGLEE